ncbi:fat-like cadherin-related tumor suppressor homolog [Cydia amplana]|uniref:fat-like cadherin-related tumor suppressor homolog n=1 Tax=Cydia amplana TaxID=1869771 RepID=UPI002FE555FF
MWGARAWLVLAAVAWCARAGPGPPPAPERAPALAFAHALYNLSIPENSAPRTAALPPPASPPLGVRLPSGAHVRFRIRHGDKDKFFKAEERAVGDFAFCFIRTRAGHADVLNRERKDFYKLEIRATAQLPSGKQLEADTIVAITITDVNDLSPLFYPTEYDVLVPEDTPAHASVARVSAEDADLGLNGEIYYSIEENTDQFAVHPTSGVVTITRALSASERARHELTVLARDRQSLLVRGDEATAARASLVVRVARANLHAPELRARRLPELVENSSAEVYAIVAVTDRDSGEHGRIASVEIVGGDPDGHFRVRPSAQPGEWDVLAHALLDRERTPRGYNLTLRAKDAGRPPRSSYLTLPVTITDANDNAPVFSRELYECTVSETAPPDTPVIRLKVSDRDEGRNARVYIEIVGGNEGGEFRINPDTGVLYTAKELDAELRALHTLTVAAVDHGNAGTRKQSSAKVQVAVLDANDNDPVFEQDELDVAVPENGPAGAVVARVTARDADSGENAYISYSLANLQPVPFDVDHFSGAIRTARVLDYESMRRDYMLRVRASDWGLPYRRQAELRLRVRLLDVNDNRPQFERVDCVGYLPRRLSAGAEIVTLSAIDFDAGDVVSYRIIGGNDDNCFALDSGTGVLSLACDLASVRADSRVLNVTATDGTHFADPTSLVLHLTGAGAGPASGALECRDTGVARRLTELLAAAERSNAPLDADEFPLAPSRYGENLHAPEFIDFPVEVKVNESVALGTTLVKLTARDRDLGYNGLLTFGISGGDPDSAFRIEPDTGELQVIGYLDRERESEYYLNVSVWDSGKPRRSASRLLPVTVLDVNDNAPRFEKTLASFRVTENAINGTAIFRANATDRDAGEFAKITYSLAGGADGEFCVERDTGMLRVCAALDRERRALYELTLRATDGGGRSAEALVRVAVDDVNDCPPRFGLSSYSARIPEDVPRGTLVAVLDAFDPDLGAGGQVTYSLPDQGDDAVFVVDERSGVLRTNKRLDFEEKQVYGVTVRATDGGQPALWSEATLIVEVLDVDENAHAPTFAERVLTGSVREDAPIGTKALHALATDADPPGRDSRLAYYIVGGSGMAHFSIDDTGVIRTLSPLDRENTPHYWLTVCAQDHGLVPQHTCVEVYIEVENVNDMAPWPERASYASSVPEHCVAGTRVAVVHADDADDTPTPSNITYTIVAGNPDGLFSIDEHTGEIVTTGRTLDREATPRHALEVSCSDGELATTVRVLVTLLDVNDHAPAFTQRFYEIRVPAAAAMQADQAEEGEGSSAEWDSDDEDDGSGARPAWDEDNDSTGAYVATVAALDDDYGANGTVRYSWRARGAARGVLRVQAKSGKIFATRVLRRHDAFDITVRACDGGTPARCGVARVSVRGAPRGGGGAPVLSAPSPLQVAELDAPGFLLHVLQATDPDGDRVYYDIVDGDEWNEFLVGREDGSLVLTKRLLHERRDRYALTVSASDGTNTATVIVNITVINDANEAGVTFSREEYTVDVSESARAGEALAALRAHTGEREHEKEGERLLYGLLAARAPASARLFRVHELTGVLELAQLLDRETAHIHELTVWARDQAPRASRAFARVTIRVHDDDEHAPEWRRRLAEARLPRNAAVGTLVAALRAADRDAGDAARIEYSLAGGDAGLFTVDPSLGDVYLSCALPAPPAPREYTLAVRAANPPPHARANTLPLHITIVEPDVAPPQLVTDSYVFEVAENEPPGVVLGAIEARGAALRYSLQGGEGRFALNPAAGLLATAAELDYEETSFYNLTVTVFAMGGGSAIAHVAVHVLDRNEFPPVLISRRYHGRVSESASRGALVSRADADAPLVLATADADSPAHQQRAFEILQPAAAALFAVHPTTGALLIKAPLDYETAKRHEFTVKVMDMGSPRLPSDSTATVIVDVEDVNDCAPVFERSSYDATVLLPTAAGVLVQALKATDADLPTNGTLKYDIIEGDAAGAFTVSPTGLVTVSQPDLLPDLARLRVRASDGRWSGTARLTVRAHPAEPAGLAFAQPEYYGAVAENSTRPATVAVLSVLGAALNEHVEFSILNPVEGFEIGVTSGAVRSTGLALDREERDSYVLLIQARSGTGADARIALARLAVSVTDVNDNCPVFVGRPYAAAVPAGAEPQAPVFTVRADDRDANDNGEVRYEMKRGHGELFRVDRRTGQVTLKQTLDAHASVYELVIAAFDGGSPPCGAEATLTVRVWAGGAAPRWDAAHYVREAREDAPPGVPLAGPLIARSPLQRPLIYSLVDPPTDGSEAPLFEIHFDTAPDRGNNPCSLVPALPLDYEQTRELELVVRATDGVTGASADALVTLHIIDVNDCPPELSQDLYDVEVSEAAAVGTTIITFHARDNDTGVNGEITYSLSGENSSLALFSLDATSGALVLAAPLDAETSAEHRLLVTAKDGGRPALADTAHLRLRVKDVNDAPPKLERPVVSALVSEEAARGTVLARVAAWDPDAGDATRLRYATVDALPTPLLSVDETTGLVTLSAPRGWPKDSSRSLNVSVSDGAHAAFARVKLTVVPANRHAPRFPHLVYEARVMENLPPPVLLTTVKADDEDGGEYGTVTYSIDSALLRETFSLDAATGALTTRVALDREAKAEWEVPVAARDGGGRIRHTTVRVRVLDANDHAPEFPLREYRASAPYNLQPHKPFLTLTAHDADIGEHARIRYELYDGELSSDASGLFEIDAVTGALAFAKNASAFSSRSVVVWARARDGGNRAGSAGVSVYVLGPGERAPRVQPPPPALFLREDAAPGTLLAELRADPTEPVPRYRLAPVNYGKDQFGLDEQGRLVLSAPLDRESARELPIGILCEGPGSPAPATLLLTTLHVLDVNEHAPTFHSQPYVVHLAENTPPHSTVVRLMATDPDAGSNGEVQFSLGEGGDSALFAVDARTGWVTTRAPLDRETKAELRVPLIASDQAPQKRSSRGTLVVRLQDYNDCPPRFEPATYSASVPEDAAAGTVVAKLTITDADATTSPLAFLVASGDPRARFQLRPSGELLVARPLDRELEESYELSVIATDGKFDARATVQVTVTDVNDNPPYCVRHRYRASLPENAAVGTRVAALETTDADLPPHDALRYFLEGEANEDFTIDKETGEVRVARALDRETRSSYALAMHAQDRARAAWRCASELLVTLTDVNDNAPRFSAELYSVTLPEDAELGTLVAKVHATDPDLGSNRLITYSFVEEEGGDGGVFSLSPDSGVLTLRAPLDREAAASHRVLLRATDGGTPPKSSTAALRLTVADVNDNPPEFEFREYRAAAPELDAPGTEILRVRATSRDTGVNAEVAYSLVAGDDREDFTIDRASGAVSIARPLDYERRRSYLLTIQALDGGSPPLGDLATLNISVIDANDNAPVFAQASYNARVREDAAINTRILQLIADDADDGANGRVTYTIARGDRDGRFSIDEDTGYISVAAPLDRETVSTYSLEVRARDRGLPALEASVRVAVEVLDANDNPPLFERANYSVVVQEDRPLGHALLKLGVTDADAAPNAMPYTFDFQAGNEAGAFRLEQDGTLRTAARFNHRVKERYALQVRVFDNGAPPLYSDAWIHVRVIEESQYPPVVTPLEIQVNSYLDEFPGGVLGRVVASDRDAYDTLTYAIAAPKPPLGLFEIDSTDGTLRAAPRLDVGEYKLNVTVADGKFISHATVRVTVLLVSDALLAQAVVVRFRAVSAEDFVLSHRKGFIRAVREAADCEVGDVVLLGAQPEGETEDWEEGTRARRQVARDLDVALAVRANGGWLAADALRRRLHAHLERLEERARLVVEELVRAACGGCVHGACAERVELRAERSRAVMSDVFALVAPPLRLRGSCACEPGWAGPRCEHEAECSGVECAAAGPRVLQLAGDGYAWLRVERGAVAGERIPEDELALTLRFRTRRAAGTLLWLAGKVDYAILEVVEGFVQFRMELGSGPVSVRSAVPVADGEWHELRLERRGAGARLTVDRRAVRGAAPPPAALLDARADRLLLGAALARHAHALAPEQVTRGFVGCITDVTLGGTLVPLEEGAGAEEAAGPRVQLVRRVRARLAAACAPLAPPTACSGYPCLNGGTCHELANLLEEGAEGEEGYRCTCHARFLGRRCEVDGDPCAAQPCLHGGVCSAAPAGSALPFVCACGAGLRGARCELGRWCGAEGAPVCQHGGACEEGEWGPSCRCLGYYGPRCEYDADECAGEPCLNGATCLNEPGSFRCLCPPDKTGMNCGNPLYSDAVMAGGIGATNTRSLRDAWRWAVESKWPLAAAAAALLLLLLLALLPLALLKRRTSHRSAEGAPLNSAKAPPRTKMSNLAAARPASCASATATLNNLDTLRSYGSAGDELEGLPPDIRRNLNVEPAERKPWSEQMHLHSFVDNKIYNDLKGCKNRLRATSPVSARRLPALSGDGAGALVGGYHWDCSDWCGGQGLPGISEVAGSERPDSSEPSPPSLPSLPSPRAARRAPRAPPAPHPPPPAPFDTDSAPDDLDMDHDPHQFTDASSYLLHPDTYLPPCAGDTTEAPPSPVSPRREARVRRDPDAASLITMLEERHSLLGGGSCSDMSAHLCEIEESDDEAPPPPPPPAPPARHTDV